jgi:tetratricopeptide (TPR) repeat protein
VDGTIEFPLMRPDELAGEAWAAMGRRDYDAALQLWERLRDLAPERRDGYVWPIHALWQSGRFAQAEALAAEGLARLPGEPELLVQHAWVAASQQDWTAAAERWAVVRVRAPERIEGYVWGARALWHAGRLDDAEGVAAEGVQRFPSELLVLMEHGWVATARHDWGAAVRRWARAHEADPDRVEPVPRLVAGERRTGAGARHQAGIVAVRGDRVGV